MKFVLGPASIVLCAALAAPIPLRSQDQLLVTTNGSRENQQVLLIDPAFGHIRSLWNNRGGSLDAIVSPDAKRLYISYFERGAGARLATIDTKNGAVLQTVEAPPLVRWIFPSWPGLATSADGHRLYLLETDYAAGPYHYFLRTLDTQAGRLLPRRRMISDCPGAQIVPVPDQDDVLLLCGEGGERRTKDWDFLLRFPEAAQGEIHAATGKLHVATSDGHIHQVSLATRQVTRSTKVPFSRISRSSGTIAPDGRWWYLPIDTAQNGKLGSEQILVFDTETMNVKTVITPNQPFWGLALSSDGEQLYASVPAAKSIVVIDTKTHEQLRTLAVGAEPSILFVVKTP